MGEQDHPIENGHKNFSLDFFKWVFTRARVMGFHNKTLHMPSYFWKSTCIQSCKLTKEVCPIHR